MKFKWLLACALLSPLLLLGCGHGNNEQGAAKSDEKIKVCYLGLTCEPPIFVAYEKGFFKEEGVDVELVKSDWDSMRDGLGLGRFQATHHLTMYMMKPIEAGLDVKIVGGIHTGCLRVQAGVKTNIKTVEDLKGKKIGITHMGSPPFLFASRVLANHGMDPKSDVEWVTFPGDAMALALDQGRIDAVASAEPIGTILLTSNKVRTVCDQALTPPYDDEYCCVVALNGKFARENPAAASKVTRALFKAAKWVNANPVAAAKLAVEKKYVSATAEINAQAIAALKYDPGVSKARRDIQSVAQEMKTAGFLKPSTDPKDLADRTWLDLEGVTDEWVQSLKVEKVADSAPLHKLSAEECTALLDSGFQCCRSSSSFGCCAGATEWLQPPGDWAYVQPLRLDRDLRPLPGGTALVHASR
jgi:NitT/TauT family transport system substrate-binding protein